MGAKFKGSLAREKISRKEESHKLIKQRNPKAEIDYLNSAESDK